MAIGRAGDDGRWRARDGKGLAQGHTASLQQHQNVNSGDLAPSQGFFMKRVFSML